MEIHVLNTQKLRFVWILMELRIKYKKIVSFIPLLILFLHIQIYAQTTISQTLTTGDTWHYACSAQQVGVQKRPEQGTLDLSQVRAAVFAIQYSPRLGFVGLDSFMLQLQIMDNNGNASLETRHFLLNVVAKDLFLKDDFGQTIVNQPIMLNPLANDVSLGGGVQLRAIPLVNHGTAAIVNNQIQFTPKVDFTGFSHIHYLACNQSDSCATAQITVYVTPNVLPDKDTLCVYSFKNQSVEFVTPLGLLPNPAFEPQHGVLIPNANSYIYQPTANFVGKDSFQLSAPNSHSQYVVYVSTLDKTPPPQYLRPDIVFTPKNSAVRKNVLLNDNQGITLSSISQVINGEATLLPNGIIEFIPFADFEGVAAVEYVGEQQGSNLTERGLLTVVVHNFMPISDEFSLTAVAGVPLKLRYPVPISAYSFDIVNLPQFGTLEYQANTNMLIYTNFQNATFDACDVRYRAGNDEKLVHLTFNIISATSACVDDCIWSGDANNDGVVNMKDLATLAQYLGAIGSPLPSSQAVWQPQTRANWVEYIKNGANLKHADLNRDGIINAADTSVLSAFYGRTHELQPTPPRFNENIMLSLIPSSQNPVSAGDMIELKILLGNENNPVKDVQGFDFAFQFDANRINPNSLSVDFKSNKWFRFSSPTLELVKKVNRNRVEAAIMQSSGRAVKGHGEVGVVRVVIVEDLCCFSQGEKSVVRFSLKDASITDSKGNIWSLPTQNGVLELREKPKSELAAPLSNADLLAYPNPANDVLRLHLNGDNVLQNVRILDILGKVVLTMPLQNQKEVNIQISQLPKGFYILEAISLNGRIVKKVEKL